MEPDFGLNSPYTRVYDDMRLIEILMYLPLYFTQRRYISLYVFFTRNIVFEHYRNTVSLYVAGKLISNCFLVTS